MHLHQIFGTRKVPQLGSFGEKMMMCEATLTQSMTSEVQQTNG